MARPFCRWAVAAFIVSAISHSASAQITGSVGNQPFKSSAQQLQGKKQGDYGAGGYTIKPGLVMNSEIYSGAGHDSNPDEQFNEIATPFLEEGGRVGLTAIGKNGAANFLASGSALQLFDDALRGDRYRGTISANGVHLLAPGVTIAGGGFISYDGFDLVEDQTIGAFSELVLNTGSVHAFVRGRYVDLDYMSDLGAPAGVPALFRPLFNVDNFDAQRAEASAGILVATDSMIGIYGEVAGADVKYTDQQLAAIVDRDAGDYYGKFGIRITPSPTLQADIGWRWNRREFDNWAQLDELSTDFFDASLRWNPWAFFSLYATVDRIIGEGSQAFSRAADIKSYAVGFNYIPFDRTTISATFGRDLINEIGTLTTANASAKYEKNRIATELTYDVTRRMQFYSGLLYEYVDEDLSDLDYERFRVGAGLRIRLTEKSGPREGFASHMAHIRNGLMNLNRPPEAILDVSAGYSHFNLPSTNMLTVVGGQFFDQALSQIEDHDGKVDGVRFDARLEKFAEHVFRTGHLFSFGFQGFYAQYSSSDRSSCTFTLTFDCAFVNINDFDRALENNTGPFGQLVARTEKNVRYWGVGLDARPGRWHGGGMKDDTPHKSSSRLRFGLALKNLKQETDLHAIDTGVPDPVDYNEDIDTFYYGAYVGLDQRLPLGHGIALKISGEAGAYYARTDYEGRYRAYVPVGGGIFIIEQGAVDLNDTTPTFIGSLRVDLEKEFSWGKIALFGEGEYLSYVPRVGINNDDFAGGSPFGVVGTQRGTRLLEDDAFNYTLGMNMSIPFH